MNEERIRLDAAKQRISWRQRDSARRIRRHAAVDPANRYAPKVEPPAPDGPLLDNFSRMPTVYIKDQASGIELPLRWQDDQSGVLPTAVGMYLDHRTKGSDVGRYALQVVADYLRYYLAAPCWDRFDAEHFDTIDQRLAAARTAEDVAQVIALCMAVGIDPL